jgi:hypothetical protein
VVRAGLAAHVAGDWHQLASLIEPSSLEEWRLAFVHTHTHVRSAEEWQDKLPKASRAAVERLAEQEAAPIREFLARMGDYVADTHTLEDLAKLSSAELLVRVLQQTDPIDRINRFSDRAYSAAGIPRPPSTYWSRLDQHYEVSGQERISDVLVHVTFRESGDAEGGTWRVVSDPSGRWRMHMSSDLFLSYSFVGVIDDPVVLAYLDEQSDP